MAGTLSALQSVVANPIHRKCARSRVRLKHMLSWGTVIVTLCSFITILVYLTATERDLATPTEAAKATLIPIIVIQCVILMLLGTGAVAGGLARERDGGLLDYHRMTPMSPTAKLLGFLFGLPAREYFLFALTLPCLLFAVIVGEFSWLTLLHFYAVFFSSVWVYHMTGMVAGMASSKPRFASIIAQGAVVFLYLVLPQLSFLGVTAFEFLTVRPTLYGMVLDELALARPGLDRAAAGAFSAVRLYREVPFFESTLHPTVYSLMVQGFLLVSMWVIVYRKWCEQHRHPFSKLHAVLVYGGILFFLTGSIWPVLSRANIYGDLVERLGMRTSQISPLQILSILMVVSLLLCGLAAVLLVHVVTPTRSTVLKGWRRAAKLGHRRVPINSDAATSLPFTLVAIGLTAAAVGALMKVAGDSERFFTHLPPATICLAPLALFSLVLLFVQGLRERFGARAFFVGVFLLWMLPLFTCMVLFAAQEKWVLGTYIALPCPPVGLGLAVVRVFTEATAVGATPEMTPPPLRAHIPLMIRCCVVAYALAAIVAQLELWRWRSSLGGSEGGTT